MTERHTSSTSLLGLGLVTLPRWFAAPVVVLGVVLGGKIAGASPGPLALAVLAGLGVMAWAHVMNAYLDYVWTGLDRGEGRSKPKPYTTGQQPIADGLLSPDQVLLIGVAWLCVSLLPVLGLHALGYVWAWLPWGVSALCTFWYSWAKLHWHPEVPLFLGFGLMATTLGATASPGQDFLLKALLAGVPFGVLFGFAAEAVDQWWDAEGNWPKGLRNLGALFWKIGHRISDLVVLEIAWGMASHVLLVFARVLPSTTLWAMIALGPCLLLVRLLDGGETLQKRTAQRRVAVLTGLFGAFLYSLLLVVLA